MRVGVSTGDGGCVPASREPVLQDVAESCTVDAHGGDERPIVLAVVEDLSGRVLPGIWQELGSSQVALIGGARGSAVFTEAFNANDDSGCC